MCSPPLLFPKDAHLEHGNELLAEIASGYPVEKKFGNRDHTLNRIHALLIQESFLPPSGLATTRQGNKNGI